MALEIQIDAKMLLVQDILLNKNKKEDRLYNPQRLGTVLMGSSL
jgi:hypothetical protein